MRAATARRYDLDWLRVLLFGLLVPYHAAIGFVSYGDTVYGLRNEQIAGDWLEMLIFFSHTWRLPALFMISGVGSWFLLRKGRVAFLRNRVVRLLVPLLFAMVFWNAAHDWAIQKSLGFTVEPVPFMMKWWTEFGFSHARHLWFLMNLFVYGLVLIAVDPWLRNAMPKDGRLLRFALILIVVVISIELLLKPLGFERPLDYRDFWYLPFFFAGFVAMEQNPSFWLKLAHIRWYLLAAGVALSLAFMPLYGAILPADAPTLANGGWWAQGWPYQSPITLVHSIAYSANAVIWCGVVFAFAYKNLNRPSPILKRLNRAVYPVFILHFPVMMVGLFFIRKIYWAWPLEFGLLTLGTFAVSIALYWLFDLSRFTRVMVGMPSDATAHPNNAVELSSR